MKPARPLRWYERLALLRRRRQRAPRVAMIVNRPIVYCDPVIR